MKTFKKIEKLQKENEELRNLLESAESELKVILAQSQEESRQLQKILQNVYPKIQNKLEKSKSQCKSISIQTDDDPNLSKSFKKIEENLPEIENYVVELVKTQKMLEEELAQAKANEEKLIEEAENGGKIIFTLEEEVLKGLEDLKKLRELNEIVETEIQYEDACGYPKSIIFDMFQVPF